MINNYADHSANERTFLAWVRTVIAIEGFGVVAARLAYGANQIWTETALLATGALVILLAFIRMRRTRFRIDSETEFDDEAVSADALLLLITVTLFTLIGVFSYHVS